MALLSSIAHKVAFLIPFSPHRGIVYGSLDKSSSSILDVGCYRGSIAYLLNYHGKRSFKVGLDRFTLYLKICKKEKLYNDYVLSDSRWLPFKNNAFDSVLCIDVIEHVPKADGVKMIKELERVASKQLIISTPVGSLAVGCPSRGRLIARTNVLQRHLSSWSPDEFRKMGFDVKSMSGPRVLGFFGYHLCYIFPLAYLFSRIPEKALHMLCVKSQNKIDLER